MLTRQAIDLNAMISSTREYYSRNMVGRVMALHEGSVKPLHNYVSVSGAIPIPSTLSIKLASAISERQFTVTYRFISDFPFRERAAHSFDPFETSLLEQLRARPEYQ